MRGYLLVILSFFTITASAQIKDPQFKLLVDSLSEYDVPLLSVEDFLNRDKHNLYILDAREEDEFAVSHLKNARYVGYFWFDMRRVYDIPVDATVVVYCTIGTRSRKICQKLIDAGYTNVFNLYGGIFEWVNQGQPVYRKNDVQTSEIHTYNQEWEQYLTRGSKVN